ncbi:arginine deiminase type-4 [Beauveria bassiana ARSEF 2860]|uniref:Arginine deiminase type-4 n=1 Tax=Beauveria bassiana (strain ARSEF 2860) TaxID=655819 RepID=J4KM39_BEAB2|nr:arginine deiminase type-4 [Beauveria bassiana ARSEF 2860]EJP63284.1 arginine deiminase type-4 [Beauveria bassiana ARSEF 2860]
MSSSAFVKSPLRRRRCRRTKQTGSYTLARDAAAHIITDYIEDKLVAYHPAVINGVVFNNGQYLAPNPWGPVVDGADILAAAANKEYAKYGFNITYIDDWFDHHAHAGEVHCATNVARDASQKWW